MTDQCKKCGGRLTCTETDSRQEWCEKLFRCDDCDQEHLLRTEYQTQSSLIESQTLTVVE